MNDTICVIHFDVSEVLLPQGGALNIEKLLLKEIYDNRKLIGSHNENPLINTLAYDVEFQDGVVKRGGAKTIAEKYFTHENLADYIRMSWKLYFTTSVMVQKSPSRKSTKIRSK